MCRRPESKVGKMFKLPGSITICSDCMQKTMDTVSQFDYQGMLNGTHVMTDDELRKLMGDAANADPSDEDKNPGKGPGSPFPGFGFVNLANLQGFGGIPNKQRLKKKDPNAKPLIDIKNLPAPLSPDRIGLKNHVRQRLLGEGMDPLEIALEYARLWRKVAVHNTP